MIVIICIDDNNGMLFNNRRQSKDSIVRQHILNDAKNSKLWMNGYSAAQFDEEDLSRICIDEDFINKAQTGDYAFVENILLNNHELSIEQLIIYHWNRKYPCDFYFDLDVCGPLWMLAGEEEFSGTSHEHITKKIYIKK